MDNRFFYTKVKKAMQWRMDSFFKMTGKTVCPYTNEISFDLYRSYT